MMMLREEDIQQNKLNDKHFLESKPLCAISFRIKTTSEEQVTVNAASNIITKSFILAQWETQQQEAKEANSPHTTDYLTLL